MNKISTITVPIKQISIQTPQKRLTLLAAGLFCIAAAVVVAKWSLGTTIAARARDVEVARLAVALAPSDPQTHYAAAVLLDRTFEPADSAAALREMETATALSPNDYLLWLALVRMREAAGDLSGAESAARQAVRLAPFYSRVRWAFGNFLLRQGRIEEAFSELRAAASSDKTYAAPIVAAALQTFSGDTAQARAAVGESPDVSVALAVALAESGRFGDALQAWKQVPAELRAASDSSRSILNKMIDAKEFSTALAFANLTSGSTSYAVGSIFNGGFEDAVSADSALPFEWSLGSGTEPQIAITDGQRRSGSRSLLMIFRPGADTGFRGISQLVVVRPQATYQFTAYYRSEVKTGAKFRWQITDLNGKALGKTAPAAPVGEWTAQQADFSVPSAVEAVRVALERDACSGTACAAIGNLWIDDVSIWER